ncbi:MAG TPA: hypothetical protein VKA03_00755 [Methylovirgula sp.]|nr:hypothetical protein [Methylovirgula sp.]
MSSTAFLARLIGLFTVVIALAILINRRGMIAAFESVSQHGDTLLVVEVIGLAAGLAIVIGHEVWTGVLGVIVTLLGWLFLLRALILMLLPPEKIAELFALVAWPQRAETYALISLVIGILLTIAGFAAS